MDNKWVSKVTEAVFLTVIEKHALIRSWSFSCLYDIIFKSNTKTIEVLSLDLKKAKMNLSREEDIFKINLYFQDIT